MDKTEILRTLKIMLWNVNCRSGFNVTDKNKIKTIEDEITKNKPNILILTEFYEKGLEDLIVELEDKGYHVATPNYETGKGRLKEEKNLDKNGILIAVKRDIIDESYEIQANGIAGNNYSKKIAINAIEKRTDPLLADKIEYSPDFLAVRFFHKSLRKWISAIGCRMLTGNSKENIARRLEYICDLVDPYNEKTKKEKEDILINFGKRLNYDEEAIQFYDVLLPEVDQILKDEERKDEIIIIGGDFNNAMDYGEKFEKFDKVKDKYKGRVQINYNLHRIHDAIVKERGFVELDNWERTYWNKGITSISDDHIFIKCTNEEQLELKKLKADIVYDGDGEAKENAKEGNNLPDHAIVSFGCEKKREQK